ncbi:MAG: methyltransferase domain-containing protein [Patescibacteria group bacterium]
MLNSYKYKLNTSRDKAVTYLKRLIKYVKNGDTLNTAVSTDTDIQHEKDLEHERNVIAYYANKKKIRMAKYENYLKTHKIKKLQLGSASLGFKDWLNTDLEDRDEEILALDVTKKFPLKTSSIDYIFSEHLIEHVTFQEGQVMLKECFRVLKPGGVIRTATPNLKFLIELYTTEKKTAFQKRYIKWAVDANLKGLGIYEDTFVINNFVRAWGHQFIYDVKILKLALQKAGFKNIIICKPGESEDPHLQNLESHGTIISKDFNNYETMVLEATKPR